MFWFVLRFLCRSGVDVASIAKTIQALGESLASEMYDLPAGDLTVLNDEFLVSWEDLLQRFFSLSQNRLSRKKTSLLGWNFWPLSRDLFSPWTRIIPCWRHCKIISASICRISRSGSSMVIKGMMHCFSRIISESTDLDFSESEIVLHGPIDVSVTASRTKQPFFDLLVTTVIGLYGGIMFLLLQVNLLVILT